MVMNGTRETLFEDEIRDIYDAEKQLVKALPKMAKAAMSGNLRQGFEEHLEVTKGHVQRLEQVFESIGAKPRGKTCEAMKGLVEEGQQAIDEGGKSDLRDIMLIVAAKRVEHYEMAAYQTLIMMAESMDNESAAELLRETLSEEEETDQKLGKLCEELLETVSSVALEDAGEESELIHAATHTRTRKAGSFDT
jgi:ferritin-like metal-binding protein YciE